MHDRELMASVKTLEWENKVYAERTLSQLLLAIATVDAMSNLSFSH